MKNILVFHEKFFEISFAPETIAPAWTKRVKIFMDIYEKKLRDLFTLVEPRRAKEEEILLVHNADYVEYVKKMSSLNEEGYLDYGDTRSYPGVFEDALLVVGGTLTLVDFVLRGENIVGFNPQGGFHHARTYSAGGFCVFNDVALAAKILAEEGFRPAIVDIDVHHGDGTQQILYKEPILKISTHMYHYGFYPGTGDVSELGEGEGYGYSVNIPFPPEAGDDVYLYAFKEIVIPLLEVYQPDVIIAQLGCDAHQGDPLALMNLTTKAYDEVSRALRKIADKYAKGRLIGMGGGGYSPEAVARCWAIMLVNFAKGPESLKDEFRDKEEGTTSSPFVWRVVERKIEYLKSALKEVHGDIF